MPMSSKSVQPAANVSEAAENYKKAVDALADVSAQIAGHETALDDLRKKAVNAETVVATARDALLDEAAK